ncbi:MAG: response regulator transcription factor [Chloroflexi bacterium]|nr:response regulator transcription factor [Chloroflexota bacterium]
MTTKRQGQQSVLVVEDDPGLLATLEFNLQTTGYHVLTASDGATALDIRRSNSVELIILDLSLPVMGGMQVCKALRDAGDRVPIIMLTAWHQENQRVDGLRSGADDYVVKPFSLSELMARVEAQLRRATMFNNLPVDGAGGGRTIEVGDLEIDLVRRSAVLDGYDLDLRTKEFDLLVHLASQPGRVFSRSQLLEGVWGGENPGGSRTIDVHVSLLRRKLEEDPSNPAHLLTVRGVGYRFVP